MAHRGGWLLGRPDVDRSFFDLFNKISNGIDLIQSKDGLHELENFQIKYGCEGFEEKNNILHQNFFRFEIDLELKIWEFKVYF
jgi:hypothetical protein